MNKEEEEAINRIYDVTHQTNGKHVNYIDINNICVDEDELESCEGFCKAIEVVLNLIQKQDKIIDKMAEHLADIIINDDNASLLPFSDSEDNLEEKVKEYFKKIVGKM